MKKLILLMFIMVLISGVSAELLSFKQGQNISLPQTCDDCTFNNITNLLYPNGSTIVSNVAMSQDGTYFNYTLHSNFTNALGTYIVNGVGDLNGVNTVWAYDFVVTPTGKIINTGNSIITFLAVLLFFILGSIFLILSFKKDMKVPIRFTIIIMAFLSFLGGLNLISVIIPDALLNENVASFFDSFTAISFILFWFAFGLIAITWFLTFFQTYFYNKNKKQLEKFGSNY